MSKELSAPNAVTGARQAKNMNKTAGMLLNRKPSRQSETYNGARRRMSPAIPSPQRRGPKRPPTDGPSGSSASEETAAERRDAAPERGRREADCRRRCRGARGRAARRLHTEVPIGERLTDIGVAETNAVK